MKEEARKADEEKARIAKIKKEAKKIAEQAAAARAAKAEEEEKADEKEAKGKIMYSSLVDILDDSEEPA